MTDPEISNRAPGPWHKRLIAFIWYDCICVLWCGVIAFFVEVSTRAPVLRVEEIGSRTGNVAVITGGPRGLAVGLVKRLLQLDYTLIMGVRNIEESKRRLDGIVQANPDLPVKNVRFLEMDLMSLKTIRKFAEEVNQQVPRIDLLLCNAANMKEPYKLTEDGYESQFQVNYLSGFLLTELLLQKLKETASTKGSPCQIIYTSSIMHEVGKFYFNELEKPIVYTNCKFYYQSKLSQVANMLRLQRQLEKEDALINVYAIHPGLIPTDLWYTGMGNLTGLFGDMARGLFRTVENGADTILLPAFSPEFQNKGGVYMASGKVRQPSNEARNEDHQLKLYEKSLQMVEIK